MEDYPSNDREFARWFRSERSCMDYLARVRWPGGFACPRCGGIKKWVVARGLFRCANCDRQTSVTAGTVFDGTRKPLKSWFYAIWEACDTERKLTATALGQALGLKSHTTAWAWMRKIRGLMEDAGVGKRKMERGMAFARMVKAAMASHKPRATSHKGKAEG